MDPHSLLIPVILFTAMISILSLWWLWDSRKKLQFELTDLIGLCLSVAWNLACFTELFSRMGFGGDQLDFLVGPVMLLLPAGFLLGRNNREKLKAKALLWRAVVSWAGFAFPSAVVPAVAFLFEFVNEEGVLRNDLPAALAWLGLVAPVLIHFWFQSIAQARKDDTPP
ncbi:MAG: hypothetical protein HS116_23160 [Planctomycetes bacterium]|nr:hypothetical protein [Planctomycetota bacterium]